MSAQALQIVDYLGRPFPRSMMVGDYEGAATGRRMNTWGLSSSGPNASLYSSTNSLRSRSRELRRNNPLIDGGSDTLVANIIGSGINPRWQIKDNPVLKEELQELWNDWTQESDFHDLLDFYGQQSLGVSALIDAGEFLCRFIPCRPGEYDTVPVKLQMLEADHLDATYNSIAPNGNEIRMGIEIDKQGRNVAYWLFTEHPGELFGLHGGGWGQRERIPKEDIAHVFKPLRIGQRRGRPWMASILVKLHELDQYEDAELVRKKTAALFGAFLTQSLSEDTNPGGILGRHVGTDANQNLIVGLEPGTVSLLPPGYDVKFSQPVDVGGSYEVWIKQQLREIAVGMGITYEQLTGDLSGVNYSSIRAGLLEFRRRIMQLQHQIIIFQFCRRVAHRFMDAAVLSGAVKIPDYIYNRRKYLRIKWRPDGWPWVDPVKDGEAQKASVRNGFKSRARIIAENGDDIETIDREIAEDNARADELGLVYDSDPRKTKETGSTSKATGQSDELDSETKPAKDGTKQTNTETDEEE
jgi:lambda family phage portal protein